MIDAAMPLAIALYIFAHMAFRLYRLGDTMTCDAEDGVIERLTARPRK